MTETERSNKSTRDFAADLRQHRFFTKNQKNYINILSQEQVPLMGDTVLLDVFLSKGNMVEPHYHINASEAIYCVTGEVIVSMIHLESNKLKEVRLAPQQVATIPQGWWHYFQALKEDTHVLTIYDTNKLETVWGSDVLRLTPPQVFAHAYCLQVQQVRDALKPLKKQVIIGPPENCKQGRGDVQEQTQTNYQQPFYTQPSYHYPPKQRFPQQHPYNH